MKFCKSFASLNVTSFSCQGISFAERGEVKRDYIVFYFHNKKKMMKKNILVLVLLDCSEWVFEHFYWQISQSYWTLSHFGKLFQLLITAQINVTFSESWHLFSVFGQYVVVCEKVNVVHLRLHVILLKRMLIQTGVERQFVNIWFGVAFLASIFYH